MVPKPSVVLEQNVVPESRVLPDLEDVPIPDADDFVIEILIDHVDDSSTVAMKISAVTGGDKKR